MAPSDQFLSPSHAARRLGVSIKALRVYELRGLLTPNRTPSGWRSYTSSDLARAEEIIALRALGLTLAEIRTALLGKPSEREATLSGHQARLTAKIGRLTQAVAALGRLRTKNALSGGGDARTSPHLPGKIVFALPWPWGGELWTLQEIKRLTFITGPLGCGKTRLALRLAETAPDAVYLGLDRADADGEVAKARMRADPQLKARVGAILCNMQSLGVAPCAQMVSLLTAVEAEGPRVLVVDLVEQGLDSAAQSAFMSYLRQRDLTGRSIFLMTRSDLILDLETVRPDEAIVYCPANHSPPILVHPMVGSPGYEAVASCLAPPSVRARTEGMRAHMPSAA